MKQTRILAALMCLTLLTVSCSRPQKNETAARKQFRNEVLLGMTPVKQQGRSSLCWAYAMLATIETEHIQRGDSVNLSAAYVARMFMKEQAEAAYLSRGSRQMTMRGMMPQLVRLIQTYGLMPYDSYHTTASINVVARKVGALATSCAARGVPMSKMSARADDLLDNTLNPLPRHIYMYGMEYTPIEFAHSVCMPDEYRAFTSFLHMPMNKPSVLPLPDNYAGDMYENMPLDSLQQLIESSVRQGHPVCWEGDISEPGFSFSRGVADVPQKQRAATPQMRQRELETFRTTDDHCMAIVGIATDREGRKFFICKNSWGKENAYGGLIYMSADYLRLKTIAVMLNGMVFS